MKEVQIWALSSSGLGNRIMDQWLNIREMLALLSCCLPLRKVIGMEVEWCRFADVHKRLPSVTRGSGKVTMTGK